MTRKSNFIQERDSFYIITNGKETEYNYFNLIKSKKSVYSVNVEFQNEDPLGLVKYAIKYKDIANQIWVVFDIDRTHIEKRLEPAIMLAKQNGIKYAYSNISFEVWLISHYEKISAQMDINKLTKRLDNILSKQNNKLKYNKSDITILKNYFIDKYVDAVRNAKLVYQSKVKEHKETYGDNMPLHIWDWNSSTNVYMLVEELKLTEK